MMKIIQGDVVRYCANAKIQDRSANNPLRTMTFTVEAAEDRFVVMVTPDGRRLSAPMKAIERV